MSLSPITWYVARAGGVVAYVLLTMSVVAGTLLAGKVRVPGFPRFAVEDVHRFLGLLAATFVGVHVAGIALDTTVPFSVSELVVPFSASFKPLWTGLGVVALELLVALAVTNGLRHKMPYRLWRSLHAMSFVIWGAATLHGVMTGSDRDQRWLVAVFVISTAVVVGSSSMRVSGALPSVRRLAIVIGSAAAAAALMVALARIPLETSSSAEGATRPVSASGGFGGSTFATHETQGS